MGTIIIIDNDFVVVYNKITNSKEGITMITLSKKKGRDFTVLNLTDPQLVTHEWEKEHVGRKVLTYTVNKLVNEIKPDLITVSGDISAAEYPEAYTNFAKMIDAYDIPWAVAWGNHDNQGGEKPIQKYVDEYKTYKNFVYEEGPKRLGNGNYVIGIEEDGKFLHGIIMMDTHDRVFEKNDKGEDVWYWGKLYPEQLPWYEGVVKELQSKSCNETTIISHIPIYAYRKAYDAAWNKEYNPEDVSFEMSKTGVCWNEGYKDSFGVNLEGICSYEHDEGMFDLIKKLGSTKLYICGHDHINSSCINYEGIRLMYGLKAGRGCYYRAPYNGGTVIKIDSEGKTNAYHHFCDEGL